MKKYMMLILMLPCICPSAASLAEEKTLEETIEKTYAFHGTGTSRRLIVDNYNGDIRIRGHRNDTVQVKITRIAWARSPEQMEKALTEVRLDISEETDVIEFYVDGPFRDKNTARTWHPGRYKVTCHFDITVPEDINVVLKTVNNGNIQVSHIHGVCSAHNMNGGIVMEGVRQVLDVYSLNEDVVVHFDRNPAQDCSIGSLNGDVRLHFLPGLSADFIIETFNGEVYSDFQSQNTLAPSFSETDRNIVNRYKTGHKGRIRIGKGGPKINWRGFNGDLLILNKERHHSLQFE